MKIDTKRLFRALTEFRKRKLELAGTDSDENYYVESEVREMQNTIREGESLMSKLTSNGLYDKRGE